MCHRDPDYDSIVEGSTVLAKFKDGLWYRGVVEDVVKGNQFSVKFLHYNGVQLLDLHSVYPIGNLTMLLFALTSKTLNGLTEQENEGDEDSDSSEISHDEEDDGQFTPRFMEEFKVSSTDKSKALGDWEKHTKGIGSRLLAKMGYVPGSGLGKEGEGRLEPVQAMVFPPGRSLGNANLV